MLKMNISTFLKILHSSGGDYMFLSSKTREYTEIVKIFKTLDPDSGAKFYMTPWRFGSETLLN
jgi:hypothetical protein